MANPRKLNFHDILLIITKEMERTQKAIAKIDLKVDDWLLQLRTISGISAAADRDAAALSPAFRQTIAFHRTKNLLAREAARGASKVEPVPLPNGDTKFIIDGLRSVTLPPRPAALLSVLMADTGPSDDEFVAWKSRAEVRHRLRKKTGKRFSPGALNTLLHRLRELLPDQALHEDYVRRDVRLGLRFALRRDISGTDMMDFAAGI